MIPMVHFYETFLAAYDPRLAGAARRVLHPHAGCVLHRTIGR